MPIAATSQRVAAVVSPRTERPWRMIAPAPRKPIPLTICAAIRVGSIRAYAWPAATKSLKPYAETSVKSAEPRQTTRCVRSPAPRSRSSRSMPIAPPSTAATDSRSRTCGQVRSGTAATARRLGECNGDRLGLQLADLGDAGLGEGEQLVEALAREGLALGGRLDLDEAAVAGHHDVHVRVGVRVLGVIEIEQRQAVDDADRDRGEGVREGARQPEAVERPPAGHVGAADGRAARAAVGLQDIAVEPH